MKIMVVFGMRPEAIKLAPVICELKRQSRVQTIVCVTAQHRQMLDHVLSLFKIAPDCDLNIMKERQTSTQVASAVLSCFEPLLQKERPAWMLVQGDTTTTTAASLAAFYARIKVAHVEKRLVLVTAHRRENFGRPLKNICLALRDLALIKEQICCIGTLKSQPVQMIVSLLMMILL